MKQLRTLLTLLGHALKQLPLHKLDGESKASLQHILSQLLNIATTDSGHALTTDTNDTKSLARWSLTRALESVSAVGFAVVVASMLRSDDEKVCYSSLSVHKDIT